MGSALHHPFPRSLANGTMAGNITRLPLWSTHFRETVIVAQSDAAEQAHLRSHAGPGADEVLCGAPVAPESKVEPQLFRALVQRLRLPLDVRCNRKLKGHECSRPHSRRASNQGARQRPAIARSC